MNTKRILSLLLSALLILMPLAAWADDRCPQNKTGRHTWTDWVTVAPTCTAPGTSTRQCTACRQTETKQTAPALGHDWDGMVTQAPTCTADGIKSFVCTRCGMTAAQGIPAMGHSWDSGVVTQEPSGFTPGVRTYTCETCLSTYTEMIDPTQTLFDRLHGVMPRSPQDDPLRITEQPSDGYASRIEDNHEWQYLKVVAEGGQQPYTYQWYYKPLFTSLGSGWTGSATSDLISWKASGLADAIGRVKDRTRPASSKIMDSWLAAHGLSGVSISQTGTSQNSSGWGGHAIEGATKDNYEAYDLGQYYCVVTDDQGRHVTSRMAKVAQGVYITEQPEDASLYGKTSVALHCAAAGGSGTYEFFLLDKAYNGEGESDDEMSVGRHIGTEASIPVTRPGQYYFWVDNKVEGGTNGICISHIATVTGEPLTDQPDVPMPGTDTTGTAYQAGAVETALTGNWFTEYEGMALQLTLNEDGTYAAAFPAQPESERTGTWRRVDNALYLDGRTFPDMTLEGDDLHCTAFEGVLRREMPETYVPAALQPSAPLERFAGQWQAKYAAVDGSILSADALEGPVDVLIDGTDVALAGDLFGDAVASMDYADGALSVSQDGVDLVLALQQDDFLRLTVTADEETVTLYCLAYDGPGLSPEPAA